MKVFPHQTTVVGQYQLIYWAQNQYKDYQILNIQWSTEYPITLQLDSLIADTQYYYYFNFEEQIRLEYLAQLYENGRQYDFHDYNDYDPLFAFQTVGNPKQPYSFNMSMSGCARTGSTSPIFYQIYQSTKPQLFIMLGDLHYSDINSDQPDQFEYAYDQISVLNVDQVGYQQVPIEYQFDDHDYGVNDADGTSKTRTIANWMYWKYVPHGDHHNYMPLFDNYPTPAIRELQEMTEEAIGTYRIRVIGRTLVIILDMRTFQIPNLTLLGDKQKAWLITILDKTAQEEWVRAVLLVSSVNFHGETWNKFRNEQLLVADRLSYLQESLNKSVLIISSDSHMTAFTNGNDQFIKPLNLKYSRGLNEAMCGSLDKPGSCKTNPLTYGPWLGRDHYTNVKIEDTFNQTCIIITGYEKYQLLFTYNTCKVEDRSMVGRTACPITLTDMIVYPIALFLIGFSIIGICYGILNFMHIRHK